MANRTDLAPILADIAETMDRVRDLDIEGHARAAALQCLADAKRHLEHVKPKESAADVVVRYSDILERIAGPSSAFPPATDNQRKRSEADEAFRASRRILREVLK